MISRQEWKTFTPEEKKAWKKTVRAINYQENKAKILAKAKARRQAKKAVTVAVPTSQGITLSEMKAWSPEERKIYKTGRRKGYYQMNKAKILAQAKARRVAKKQRLLKGVYPSVVSAPMRDVTHTLSVPLGRKLSAYNVYVKNNYRQVKANNPGIKSKDIMRILGQQWRNFKTKDGGFFF